MHVGMSVFFQNLGTPRSDQDVYAHELSMADLAEPLGFDSVWAAEHHFTDYTMCPSVIQFLTWVGARTERVGLGAMIIVLPWHDPVRVAERARESMLQAPTASTFRPRRLSGDYRV